MRGNNLQGFPGTYSITGYIAGTTFTVTSAPSGKVGVNTSFYGAGVSLNTYVTALGTGIGGTGTYTVTPSQTLGSSGSPVTMTAVAYTVPQGPCTDNGVGEMVRNFRIGTTQTMGAGFAVSGDVYDDGLDPSRATGTRAPPTPATSSPRRSSSASRRRSTQAAFRPRSANG